VTLKTALLAVLTAFTASGHWLTLAWDASPDAAHLAGYRLWVGTASRSYAYAVDAGTNLTVSLQLTAPGTFYFAATATGTNGLESDWSNECTFLHPVDPPLLKCELAVVVTPQGLTSTNLADWQPWTFTPTLLDPTNAAQWFSVTGLTVRPVRIPAD
jgi:hypothetical protein